MARRRLRAITPRALAALALFISPLVAHAQQRPDRAFTLDDALAVRTSRIDDVSKDGRWIALSVRVRIVILNAIFYQSALRRSPSEASTA